MPFVTPRRDSIRYDGTNGTHIAGVWCTALGFVSDTGTVLTYTDRDGYKQTANLGDWFIISGTGDGYPTVLAQAGYELYFVEIPPMPG
ncbi:hypothetical protein [Streptomyces sp. SID12488]|uniref:hypothetical protein n=1 Tax=Streptomyces sp. SID12488 TaxID=2706040 RepID=UPI0013DB453E|nr:hypothetical protein [Streptomyces sp. SID12488]NEA67556.1 hypothetical protein [Streptomyces sp. SID12488]